MTWRDNLEQASFRGVDFFIDSHDYEFGPKNIIHEYPFNDKAELENQGVATDSFSMNAYVLASLNNRFNYFKARDKLINALKEKTSGKLVHRYLGDKNVAVVGTARMTEQFNEGGIARFQISFKEVVDKAPTGVSFDPIGAIDAFVSDLLDSFDDAFGAVFDATADLSRVSSAITSGMQSIISNINTLKSLPGSAISSATSIVLSANSLAQSVLSTPCDLVSAITGGFNSFLFVAGMLEDTLSRDILGKCSGRVQNQVTADRDPDELDQEEGTSATQASANMAVFGDTLPVINVVSPSSASDQANQQAVIDVFRATGLATAARIAVRTTFTSQDEANALLAYISKLIDDYLDYLGGLAGDDALPNQGITFSNDDIYTGIKQLKALLKKSFDSIGADLAKIVDYKVGPEVLSTLTLAYDRYEDLSREQEIVNRNLIILNPCFIPGGKIIDILSE